MGWQLDIFKKWYFWVLVVVTVVLSLIGGGGNPFKISVSYSFGSMLWFFVFPFLVIFIPQGIYRLIYKKKQINPRP